MSIKAKDNSRQRIQTIFTTLISRNTMPQDLIESGNDEISALMDSGWQVLNVTIITRDPTMVERVTTLIKPPESEATDDK